MTVPFQQVVEAYQDYLLTEKCMKPRSVRDYMTVLIDLSKRIDVLNTTSFKPINDAVKDMKKQYEWSQGTVYKYAVCVKHFYRWAKRDEYIKENPYPFTDFEKPKRSTPKFITQQLFDSILDDPDLSHKEETLLFTFWDSAGRLSEVQALTQDDFFFDQKFFLDPDTRQIEMEGHYVRFKFEITKGNYSFRNVPFSDHLKGLLLKQFRHVRARGHQKAIFLNPQNEPLSSSGISKVLHNIGMRQSPFRPLMNLSAHMFRHSFGIRMLEKGVPELIVQKLLGHETLEMTGRYINMTAENAMRIFTQRGALPARRELAYA